MGEGSTVTVTATGMKAIINKIFPAGVITIECITTGKQLTVLAGQVTPYKLLH